MKKWVVDSSLKTALNSQPLKKLPVCFYQRDSILKWNLIIIPLLFLASALDAQQATITGRIYDQHSLLSLPAAAVTLEASDGTQISTNSDSSGTFLISDIPATRYALHVVYLGYSSRTIPGLLLESGKDLTVDVALRRDASTLAEISVTAKTSTPLDLPTSAHPIDVEELERFPATFNDPARYITAFPGATVVNDQSNAVSIRGNSPEYNVWLIEGLEIVNPNHTSNAGTFRDLPTQSSGGVTILSGQVLDNSTFLKGGYPSRYGNAIAGIMDMKFRHGNIRRPEFTVQLGLIGLDFAAEGPISKKAGSSYLMNYRYSTVGLLDALGVDLGNEKINFQDLSFHVGLQSENGLSLGFFGFGGISSNVRERIEDSDEWEVTQDAQNIEFNSRMGALGMNLKAPFKRNRSLNFGIAASASESTHYLDLVVPVLNREQDYEEQPTKVSSKILFVSNPKAGPQKVGVDFLYHKRKFYVNNNPTIHLDSNRQAGILISPFIESEVNLTKRIVLFSGLRFNYSSINKDQSVDPRVALQFKIGKSNRLSLSSGLHTQVPRDHLLFSFPICTSTCQDSSDPNFHLESIRSFQNAISYRRAFPKNWGFTAEVYYNWMTKIPVTSEDQILANLQFSSLNLIGESLDKASSDGEARMYGVELMLEKYMSRGFYFLLAANYYRSFSNTLYYPSLDRSHWDGICSSNLVTGKEFNISSKRQSVLGFNLSSVFHINYPELGLSRGDLFDDDNGTRFNSLYRWHQTLQEYFNLNIRIYYRMNKGKTSSIISLDIQNVTNMRNEAFTQWNGYLRRDEQVTQLGMIPILNWKLEI